MEISPQEVENRRRKYADDLAACAAPPYVAASMCLDSDIVKSFTGYLQNESKGIVAALNKQIAATSAPYKIAITADLCDEPDISLEREEVLYRIAQEALYNTVKRVGATSVRICVGAR